VIIASFVMSRESVFGVINEGTGEQFYHTLPLEDVKGITGLTLIDDSIYAAVQLSSDTAIAVLDAHSLALKKLVPIDLDTAGDVHSIFATGNQKLYVVSTATDELVVYQFDGNSLTDPKVVWRPDPDLPRGDFNHLTSVWERAGVIYVAAFGRKTDREEEHWSTATNGFVYNLTADEELATDIQHPHSACLMEDKLVYCESLLGKLHGPESEREIGGYPRGLCMADGSIFAGVSVNRDGTGTCKVMQLKKDDLSYVKEYDFGLHGNEIYDLVYVPD